MQKTVGVLVGSLRKEAFSLKAAKALISLAPGADHKLLSFEMIEIGQLPIYNQDFDDEERPPAEWTAFRAKVLSLDALLFVTPEYNRSVPAVLKNAIDVGSRPYGKNVWGKKSAAVVSTSPGAIGGFGANHHLRQALMAVDVRTMQAPEAYIGGAANLFNERGELINAGTQKFFKSFMGAFSRWIDAESAHLSKAA